MSKEFNYGVVKLQSDVEVSRRYDDIVTDIYINLKFDLASIGCDTEQARKIANTLVNTLEAEVKRYGAESREREAE